MAPKTPPDGGFKFSGKAQLDSCEGEREKEQLAVLSMFSGSQHTQKMTPMEMSSLVVLLILEMSFSILSTTESVAALA